MSTQHNIPRCITYEFTLRQDSHLRIVQVLLAIVFFDVVRHRSEATQSMIESLDELGK
jgi:hypothetical protein